MKESYLKKLHEELIYILDDIVKICNENNIRYYLEAGSLLGAVRHSGFIPWDDDLDIVMPRKDYDKFIKIAPALLDKNNRIDHIAFNKEYWQDFMKVRNTATAFHEELDDKVMKGGIFVDIFPLDETNGPTLGVKIRKKIVNALHLIMCIKASSGGKGITKILSKMLSYDVLHKLCDFVMSYSNNRKNHYYSNFASLYSIERTTMPIDWYGEGVEIPFEGKKYRVPTQYKKVVESIYGPNYMQLPPEDKRRTHYPIYVQFRDGSSIEFEHVANKVTVEESISI